MHDCIEISRCSCHKLKTWSRLDFSEAWYWALSWPTADVSETDYFGIPKGSVIFYESIHMIDQVVNEDCVQSLHDLVHLMRKTHSPLRLSFSSDFFPIFAQQSDFYHMHMIFAQLSDFSPTSIWSLLNNLISPPQAYDLCSTIWFLPPQTWNRTAFVRMIAGSWRVW
jgi:hypothetical protein